MTKQRKILVIEDDEEVTGIMHKRLTQEGFLPYIAGTGEKAIKLFEQILPDLILVDIVLPDIYGPEIITLLRQKYFPFTTPVLFLSGVVDNSDDTSTIKAGGQLYPAIGKPFDWRRLVSKINDLLD